MQAVGARASTTGEGQAVALSLLTALVDEMNPVTASSLALPWSFHEQCRVSFADSFLVGVFETAAAVAVAQPVAPAPDIAARAFLLRKAAFHSHECHGHVC